MQHQRANRQRYSYRQSRFYTMVDPESSQEHWMYIDEYENQEAFDSMWSAVEKQPDLFYSDDPAEAARMREEKRSLTVPGSAKKELWTQRQELAVD